MGNRNSTISGDSSSNHTCPTESLAENATENAVANLTFYEFNRILGGACAAFALVTMIIFLFSHATHLSKPNEQIKIMRIALIIPLYAIISYIKILAPSAEVYLDPWLEFIQSISLGSFFLLMCEYVSPSESQRDVFFAALEMEDKQSATGTKDGLEWFRKRWFLVFQYPIVALLVSIFTDITQAAGVYCQFATEYYFAKLWLGIAMNVSLAVAVLAVLKFYGALKTHLKHQRPLLKLLAFKLIVGLTFLESIIFWILSATSVLKPSPKLTWADLHIALPNLLVCMEMVFFSLFFFYAYPVRPYLLSHQQAQFRVASDTGNTGTYAGPQSYQGGFLGVRAWLGVLNFGEIVQAIVFGFRMAGESRRRGGLGRGSARYGLLERPKPHAGSEEYQQPAYGQGQGMYGQSQGRY